MCASGKYREPISVHVGALNWSTCFLNCIWISWWTLTKLNETHRTVFGWYTLLREMFVVYAVYGNKWILLFLTKQKAYVHWHLWIFKEACEFLDGLVISECLKCLDVSRIDSVVFIVAALFIKREFVSMVFYQSKLYWKVIRMFGKHVGVCKTNGERSSVTSASNFDGKLKCQGIWDLIRPTFV